MTITLTLTPEEEAQLRHKAALSGQPAEDYALALLRQDFAPADRNGSGHDAPPDGTHAPAPSHAETLAGRVALFDGNGTGYEASLPDDAPLRESLAEWLAEVEASDPIPHPVPDKNKEYVDLLVEKYRKQGLQL